MMIALDPFMHRRLALAPVVRLAADLGYEYLEISPRDDFLPLFNPPGADSARIAELKSALREMGVRLASLFTVYRWASPHEGERRVAMDYWKRALEVAVELDCRVINSEFSRGPSPHLSNFCAGPETAEESEPAFRASLEELLPILEREGITLHLEPHPDDFIEDGNRAVDMIRAVGSPHVKYLYCAPHTFHMGDDMAGMMEYAAPVLAHVHVADTFNHKASSGLRYIVNPPGSPARIHQHLNIGEGEIDWDLFFLTLQKIHFDGILTSCVFAWEDRAVESSRLMLERIRHYLQKYPPEKVVP
jgi:myo-inositol catabolism protein IolH